MKAKPLKLINTVFHDCEPSEATHVQLNMPCILSTRFIPVQTSGDRKNTDNWSWNGDVEKPTLKPSILTRQHIDGKEIRCHSFVNDGMVQFLSDCSHEEANKTLPLNEVLN